MLYLLSSLSDASLANNNSEKSWKLVPEEEIKSRIRLKQLPLRAGPEKESFFTIWAKTNDSRTQEEIITEAY